MPRRAEDRHSMLVAFLVFVLIFAVERCVYVGDRDLCIHTVLVQGGGNRVLYRVAAATWM